MTFKKLPVESRNSMVSAGHSLITSTGLDILRKGGNAMDASVAMALTASVVFPDMCGLGGDGFLLYYHKQSKEVYALNGSGQAPINHTISYYQQSGYDKVPETGPLSISIPGLVDLLFKGLKRFGSFSFPDLINDAVDLANNGVPISFRTKSSIQKKEELIAKNDCLSSYLFSCQNQLRNSKLAGLIERLANDGPRYFYEKCAHDFVDELNQLGASFVIDDFASYSSEWLDPISIKYRDRFTIYQSPLVSQGVIMLEIMGLLNEINIEEIGNADLVHLIVEAKKIAFNDRVTKLEDPEFTEFDVSTLLSKEYLSRKFKEIDINHAHIIPGSQKDNHTTSFVVVDEMGNACSFIMSISDIFGSGIMNSKHGVIFNNRIGTNFHLDVTKPNHLDGGKRTLSTLITYLITDENGDLSLVGNTPGGDNQPIWCVQNVVNILDKNLDAQQALNMPKFYDLQTSNPYNKSVENILYLESSFDKNLVEELSNKGHVIELIEQASGSSHVIQIKDGKLIGGSDPRTEATSMGY